MLRTKDDRGRSWKQKADPLLYIQFGTEENAPVVHGDSSGTDLPADERHWFGRMVHGTQMGRFLIMWSTRADDGSVQSSVGPPLTLVHRF